VPTRSDLAGRAAALAAAGTPFVWATVVRAERPTSAKPGDSALVLADGQLDGFVGGDCAESTVRAQALDALSTGETRLVRISPDPVPADGGPTPGGEVVLPGGDGVVSVHNPCLSGGTLEVFLEPSTPLPVIAVYGTAPIAAALVRADRVFGQQIRPLVAAEDPLPPGTVGVVVASHGNDEGPVLTRALQAGVPYVGLVASRVRGPAVVGALDVADELRRAVRTPAGFDIGARTPAEVALSILAEIVAGQHDRALSEHAAEDGPTADRAAEARAAAVRAAYLDHPSAYVT
jgi:xanthine dehydrogenase accessory factor